MAYEQKDNSGILFINDRKASDNHPDRTGNCMIEGRQFWVSGWVKQGAKGPFMTLAFKPKDGQEREVAKPQPRYADERPAPMRRKPTTREDLDDEIPF